MNDIINNIVDDGEQYPIHANYALNIITTVARINGNTIGIIANQPLEFAGVLDIDSSDKIAIIAGYKPVVTNEKSLSTFITYLTDFIFLDQKEHLPN